MSDNDQPYNNGAHRTSKAQSFIDGGDETPPPPTSTDPWDQPGVRPDVKKNFSLLLPEPVKLKLEFIAQARGGGANGAQQAWVRDKLFPLIEREVVKIKRERGEIE